MQSPIDKEFRESLQTGWAIQVRDSDTEDELLHILSQRINALIECNFPLLISLLYRIDISEKKLKQLLQEHKNTDAGNIIAHLILEREKQKIKSRQQYNRRDDSINDDDKW